MILVGKQVVHRIFGKGNVLSVGEGRITIRFDENTGEKMFSYPAAFEKHLQMCGVEERKFTECELSACLAKTAAENARKEQEIRNEANRRAEERKAARRTSRSKKKESI